MTKPRKTRKEREDYNAYKYNVKPYVQIKATRENAIKARKEALNTIVELETLLMHLGITDEVDAARHLIVGTKVVYPLFTKMLTAYAIQIGEQCNLLARYIRNKDLDYIDEHSLLYTVAEIRHGLVHDYIETSNEKLMAFILYIYTQRLKHVIVNYEVILHRRGT